MSWAIAIILYLLGAAITYIMEADWIYEGNITEHFMVGGMALLWPLLAIALILMTSKEMYDEKKEKEAVKAAKAEAAKAATE